MRLVGMPARVAEALIVVVPTEPVRGVLTAVRWVAGFEEVVVDTGGIVCFGVVVVVVVVRPGTVTTGNEVDGGEVVDGTTVVTRYLFGPDRSGPHKAVAASIVMTR